VSVEEVEINVAAKCIALQYDVVPAHPDEGTLDYKLHYYLQDQSELRHLTAVYCRAPRGYCHCHCLRLRTYESSRLILLEWLPPCSAFGILSTVPHWAMTNFRIKIMASHISSGHHTSFRAYAVPAALEAFGLIDHSTFFLPMRDQCVITRER
jgi:hypothetical protein